MGGGGCVCTWACLTVRVSDVYYNDIVDEAGGIAKTSSSNL